MMPADKTSFFQPLALAALLAPPIAAPSGRGLVPVLIVCGLWALFRAYQNKRLDDVLRSGPTALLAALVVLAGLSAFWAVSGMAALKETLGFAGLALVGLALLHEAGNLDDAGRKAVGSALTVGVIIALVLFFIGYGYGLQTGSPLWARPEEHPFRELRHSQTVLILALWPLAAFLRSRGQSALLIALAGVVVVAFAVTDHRASQVAMVLGMMALMLSLRFGTCWLKPLGLFVAVGFFLTPFFMSMIPDAAGIEALARQYGQDPNALHRIFGWRFAVDRIWEQPWFGWGMDASRAIPGAKDKILWGIEQMPLHPHNGSLQMWLELGMAGALIGAAAITRAISGCGRLSDDRFAIGCGLGLVVSYLIYGAISYGLWQSWWMAAAWLFLALIRAVAVTGRDRTLAEPDN